MQADYRVVVHAGVLDKAQALLAALQSGAAVPGGRLQARLRNLDLQTLEPEPLLHQLCNTKLPQIFAESAVRGDASDWTLAELSLLGDLNVAVPVTVFDNGRHRQPDLHQPPLSAHLLYSSGALLCNGFGLTPADWPEVVAGRRIDQTGYDALYERRLLPLLRFANELASAQGKKALVTLPGLGCGQFAGVFRGTLATHLQRALEQLLARHAAQLQAIALLYFDPYDEGDNADLQFGQTRLRTRPLLQGNQHKPQLCAPQSYAEADEDWRNCELFSVVAWDPVSWPGNDFYAGARATDDGVKAAATDSMLKLTAVAGCYNTRRFKYQPPSPFRDWGKVVQDQALEMQLQGNLVIYPA